MYVWGNPSCKRRSKRKLGIRFLHCWLLSCTFLLIKSVTEISKGDEYFLTYLWRYCCCFVAQLFCLFCDPVNFSPTRLLRPWSFPGKNTGVAHYFLCQGFFLSQGLNARLLVWQADSSLPSHQGSACADAAVLRSVLSDSSWPCGDGYYLNTQKNEIEFIVMEGGNVFR